MLQNEIDIWVIDKKSHFTCEVKYKVYMSRNCQGPKVKVYRTDIGCRWNLHWNRKTGYFLTEI